MQENETIILQRQKRPISLDDLRKVYLLFRIHIKNMYDKKDSYVNNIHINEQFLFHKAYT